MKKAERLKRAVVMEELESIKEVKNGFFDSFIEREFISQHRIIFFHTSHIRGKWMYYCTHCNSFHVVDCNWKDGSVHTCDGCHRRLIVQRYSKIEPVKGYIVKFESNKRNELIVRYFYIMRDIKKTKHGYDEIHGVMEIGRMNKTYGIGIKRNSSRTIQGLIYHSFWNNLEEWKEDRTDFWRIYPTDHVHRPKIGKVMKDTGYSYSGFKEAMKKGFELLDYLYIYDNCPALERLVKSEATKYLNDMIGNMHFYGYGRFTNLLNRATKKQIGHIIKHNLKYKEAKILIDADEINPDFDLIKMMAEANFNEKYESAKKIKRTLKYICDCNKQEKRKIHYQDYRDYVEMSHANGASFDKYPKDFWNSHDKASKEFKLAENKNYDKLIRKRSLSKELSGLAYINKKLMIRPVSSLKELCVESEKLHHCVRKYAKRVAFGDTNILFIRDTSNKEEPFVTLELQGNNVTQCRAKYNARPSEETISFVNSWCRMNNFISCF